MGFLCKKEDEDKSEEVGVFAFAYQGNCFQFSEHLLSTM